MSADQPQVPTTGDGSVDPDNFHAEGTTGKPAVKPDNFHAETVKPDNFHAEGTKQ